LALSIYLFSLFFSLFLPLAELMLLGFISLLLTVAQTPISKICIPESAANIMLPCKAGQDIVKGLKGKKDHRRRLLWYTGEEESHRRSLAGAAGEDYCAQSVSKNAA
jgi:mlo protein